MLAYVAIRLQCVMLCYCVVNSKCVACGGRSSVPLCCSWSKTQPVLPRPVGHETETEFCSV
jgi:hypothetical protein